MLFWLHHTSRKQQAFIPAVMHCHAMFSPGGWGTLDRSPTCSWWKFRWGMSASRMAASVSMTCEAIKQSDSVVYISFHVRVRVSVQAFINFPEPPGWAGSKLRLIDQPFLMQVFQKGVCPYPCLVFSFIGFLMAVSPWFSVLTDSSLPQTRCVSHHRYRCAPRSGDSHASGSAQHM